MPSKQKVTLYLSDDLHRQFKIRSAIDGETMSSMAQRAMEFYLGHAELVEGASVESVGGSASEHHGQTHLVHSCPQCAAAVALRDGGLMLIRDYSERQYDNLNRLERLSEQCIPEQRVPEQSIPGACLSDSLLDRRGDSGRTASQSSSTQSSSKSPEEGELITC
jgi:hypothetical protein